MHLLTTPQPIRIHSSPPHLLLRTMLGAPRRAWQRWRRLRDACETRRFLSELSDRTLHDLGLHRSEIGSLAAEVGGLAHAERRARCPL